jgi:hypothetical protein
LILESNIQVCETPAQTGNPSMPHWGAGPKNLKQGFEAEGFEGEYHYDHRAFVPLRSLATDIRKSVPRYLRHLKIDKGARDRFKRCMKDFFPR